MTSNTSDSRNAWNQIEKEYGISKRAFARKINFVTDQFKRRILFRDIEHAYVLADRGFSKPGVILAGSVIEELLRLYLKHQGFNVNNKTFDEYIRICENKGILKLAITRLGDAVRHFRNLVHLERESNPRHVISKSTAKASVASVFIIVNDF